MKSKQKDPNEKLINGQDDLRIDYRHHIPASKLKRGSLKNKVPVRLSDGRTTVYIDRGKSVRKARERYEKIIRGIREIGTEIDNNDKN